MRLFLPVLLLLLLPRLVAASDPLSLGREVNRTEATVGDRLQYTLSIEWDPKRVEIVEPVIGATLGPFEVLEQTAQEPLAAQPSLRRKVWVLTLASFETGELTIPAIPVEYRLDGVATEAQFAETPVTIASSIDAALGEGRLFDQKPPLVVAADPFYRNRLLALCALAILLLAPAIWGWRRWRTRRHAAAIVEIVDTRTPEQIALDELDTLAAQGMPSAERTKSYYSAVADILRAYLGRKFGIDALDLTTNELMRELEQGCIIVTLHRRIESLLNDADMVKFAKWIPEPQRTETAIPSVREIVCDTLALTAEAQSAQEVVSR